MPARGPRNARRRCGRRIPARPARPPPRRTGARPAKPPSPREPSRTGRSRRSLSRRTAGRRRPAPPLRPEPRTGAVRRRPAGGSGGRRGTNPAVRLTRPGSRADRRRSRSGQSKSPSPAENRMRFFPGGPTGTGPRPPRRRGDPSRTRPRNPARSVCPAAHPRDRVSPTGRSGLSSSWTRSRSRRSPPTVAGAGVSAPRGGPRAVGRSCSSPSSAAAPAKPPRRRSPSPRPRWPRETRRWNPASPVKWNWSSRRP